LNLITQKRCHTFTAQNYPTAKDSKSVKGFLTKSDNAGPHPNTTSVKGYNVNLEGCKKSSAMIMAITSILGGAIGSSAKR
jgi:hypothetical protein